MRRREQREHVFKLMFMTEFNSEEEMTEQLSLYFEGLGELSEQDQEYMKKKYAHVREHLEDIDAQLNSASRGWKTKRMSRVDLAALRLAVYEMEYDEDVPTGDVYKRQNYMRYVSVWEGPCFLPTMGENVFCGRKTQNLIW